MKRKMCWLTFWFGARYNHEVKIELRPENLQKDQIPYVQALYRNSKGKPVAVRLDNEALLVAVKDAQRRKVE